MAEKSEKATPKKLRDARKKGQVAKSQDFPSAFTFVVSITTILLSSAYLYEQLAGFIISMFRMSASPNLNLQNQASGVSSKYSTATAIWTGFVITALALFTAAGPS